MEYGDYKWKFNPKKIEINEERNIKEQIIPFFGNVFQDYGRKKRIVKGYGEFFGDDAIEQYNELYMVFKLGEVKYLKLPKLSPFLAAFVSLDLLADSNPDFVRYEFEFWENVIEKGSYDILKSGNDYTIKRGDTLWSIANLYSISIDKLLKENPQIKRPDELVIGQKVILPWYIREQQ